MHDKSGNNEHTPPLKKKRHTKEEQEKLKNLILRILEAGYDLGSLQLILDIRKDRIATCLMDMAESPCPYTALPQYRQILHASKLRGLHGIDQSEYWEATRLPNAVLHLSAVNLSELRKSMELIN